MHEGSCLCSAIRWSLAQNPGPVTHCHCRMCRKQHGAAFATYAQVERKHLTITDPEGKLVHYRSSEKGTRSFCGACGSSLFWASTVEPSLVGVAIGTLDGPLGVPVFAHIFAGDKADWVTLDDDLRKYEGDYVADAPAPK